jgi:hypothetical protein
MYVYGLCQRLATFVYKVCNLKSTKSPEFSNQRVLRNLTCLLLTATWSNWLLTIPFHLGFRVARSYTYFHTKNPNLGKFLRVLHWKMLIYFTDIWYIYLPFCIFCGKFGKFFPFWYVVPKKNLAFLLAFVAALFRYLFDVSNCRKKCENINYVTINRVAINWIAINWVAINWITINLIMINRDSINWVAINRVAVNRVAINRWQKIWPQISDQICMYLWRQLYLQPVKDQCL